MQTQPKLITNTWLPATWEAFLQATDDPTYAKAKGYYYDGEMRLEMGVGPDHASDNTIIILIIGILCGLRGIPIKGLTNCSYRKTGIREAQPDVSYYVGERVALAPQGSSIVSLDQVPPPDLTIEIADSSFNDDLGKKRLLYEDMGVREYWIVDVETAQIIAFEIVENGSRRIENSQVLQIEIAAIREAIEQHRQMDDSQLTAWLLNRFR
jgi:Uma2 family endonuclease